MLLHWDIHKLYIYLIALYTGLNSLQVHVHVDQVNIENGNQTSTYTQVHVVPSKLIAAAFNAHIQ